MIVPTGLSEIVSAATTVLILVGLTLICLFILLLVALLVHRDGWNRALDYAEES
jgi:hypothetical protein